MKEAHGCHDTAQDTSAAKWALGQTEVGEAIGPQQKTNGTHKPNFGSAGLEWRK